MSCAITDASTSSARIVRIKPPLFSWALTAIVGIIVMNRSKDQLGLGYPEKCPFPRDLEILKMVTPEDLPHPGLLIKARRGGNTALVSLKEHGVNNTIHALG